MQCTSCEATKTDSEFSSSGKGRTRHTCKSCDNIARKARAQHTPTKEQQRAWATRNSAKQKRERREGINTAKYIYWDLKKDDKKKGRDNDLTKEFIEEQIVKGCTYCGETEMRMTMDRIDNDQGHTKDNVVPACIRCNYLRGCMPYDAWIRMTPTVREIRKEGLFGDWTGRARVAK